MPAGRIPGASAAEQAMALLMRPVRHAVNNQSMVLTANLDSALPRLPEGEVVTRQVTRARDAALEYDALARGFLALGREEGTRPAPAKRVLEELRPLLSLAAGGVVEVNVGDSAVIERRSPSLEGALILAASGAAGLPPGPRPALRLDGARLSLAWPVPEEARVALEALGAVVEPHDKGVVVVFALA